MATGSAPRRRDVGAHGPTGSQARERSRELDVPREFSPAPQGQPTAKRAETCEAGWDERSASDEPAELAEPPGNVLGSDAFAKVDALGSAPVVRVVWPEIADHPRRRNLLPAIALLGSAAAVLAAALVVLSNRPPRRANTLELPAAAAQARDADRTRAARPSEPYGAAIRAHERDLRRCVQFHGETFPVDAEAVISIGLDGRPREVALRPDIAEHSPLGSCIRGVLEGVAFPAAPSEMEVAVGLALYR